MVSAYIRDVEIPRESAELRSILISAVNHAVKVFLSC